jgi:hypothetical protein
MLKIFNDFSKDVNDLQSDFIPIANHLLSFIKYFCENNKTYGYEIVCTKRSWYGQKQVTLIAEDNKNGLSWYLYGNAISINVYEKVQDQILDSADSTDYVKNTINFQDGSALTFIEAAQDWFNSNSLNGNIVKIFGVYPNVKSNIGVSSSALTAKYKDDKYTIYWGGLFKGYSNFTHWEWHPGYSPNDISKIRESFLNNVYSQYDILDNLNSESSISGATYLNDEIELIEEDFMAIWKLKCEINLKREYTFFDLITWAKNNPYSLSQIITYSRIIGDYNQYSLFNSLSSEISSIDYSNNVLTSTSFTITEDDYGHTYFNYYNEFGDKITLLTTTEYILPTDIMPDAETFDQIQLTLDDSTNLVTNTGSNISIDNITKEIEDTSKTYTDSKFDINEHGLIGDLSINTNKLIDSFDNANKLVKANTIFEEMITPPNNKIHTTKKGVIDISKAIKNSKVKNSDDEMITPPSN